MYFVYVLIINNSNNARLVCKPRVANILIDIIAPRECNAVSQRVGLEAILICTCMPISGRRIAIGLCCLSVHLSVTSCTADV